MGKIKDLSQGNLGDVARQQHRDQYSTPLNGSSVGSGGIRFYGTGELTVENEGLNVTGMATITGALNVSGSTVLSGSTTMAGPTGITGTLTVQGATTVSGNFTVNGPTKLNGITDIGGNTKITGTLDVTGVTKLAGDTTVSGKLDVTGAMATKGTLSVEGVNTLKNDLNVTTGGKIKVGAMTIEPIAGGQLNFMGGAISRSGTFGMLANDAIAVELAAPTVKLNGTAVIVLGLPTTSQPANLYADGSGRLFRSTAP